MKASGGVGNPVRPFGAVAAQMTRGPLIIVGCVPASETRLTSEMVLPMQFWDYFTHFQWAKAQPELRRELKAMEVGAFYEWYFAQMNARAIASAGRRLEEIDPFTPALLTLEREWTVAGRPYYNLWPSLLPALSRLKMEADAALFKLPLGQLLLRFPKTENPLEWEHGEKKWAVRTVLCENSQLVRDAKPGAASLLIREGPKPPDTVRGLTFWIDAGEDLDGAQTSGDNPNSIRRLMYKHLVCQEGHSIEWSFENIPPHMSTDIGLIYPTWILHAVARIVCTLCLMADDPHVVEPVVLRDDEDRYERNPDPALVEKARRRGNYGWNVGRSIEVMPHVRAACPAALYWTGEGRRIPKIRFRRGSIVHRKKFSSMPTGFLEEGDHERFAVTPRGPHGSLLAAFTSSLLPLGPPFVPSLVHLVDGLLRDPVLGFL